MNHLKPPRRLWIGGQWVASADVSTLVDPYTGETIADVSLADPVLVDASIAAADGAFAVTRRLPPFERAEFLRAAADILRRRAGELADTIVAEAGKPITLAEAEVERAATTFSVAAAEARGFEGDVVNMQAYPAGRGHFGMVRRFPVGVIYGITPFNFPLNLVAHKVAPALASGNTIVIKPSPRTPLSALLLAEVLDEAGVPKGAYNVIVTPNDLAARPIDDPRVKHVSFTGSAAVGWQVKARAVRQGVTLELGGNAALIVHEDADLPAAVSAVATGAFGYAGQSCISVQRLLVHRPIYQRFTDDFLAYVRTNIHTGDPRDRRTLVGPLIDDASAERVRRLITDAVNAGARVLCGNAFDGRCMQPTVLDSVDPKLEVCTTEAFAPLVTLHPYDRFDQAIEMVNDSIYGLQAGVFTRDVSRAFEAFERLEVGGVMVNQVPTFRVDNMPYGGVKESGFGREGVRYAMEAMTEPRVLVLRLQSE